MPSDTSAAAQAHLDALYRRMPATAKLRRVLGLTELTRSLALAEERRIHPEESECQLRLRVAARHLDGELLARWLEWRGCRPVK